MFKISPRNITAAGGTFDGDVFMQGNTISGAVVSTLVMGNLYGFNAGIWGLPHDSFLSLTDTPSTFSGLGGKVVYVKEDESSLDFSIADLIDEFTDLLDTPDTYSVGSYLKSTASGVEWAELEDDFYTKDEIDTISGTLNDKIERINFNTLSFAGNPTYNGVLRLLGWYINCNQLPSGDPFELSSGSYVESEYQGFHSHFVVNMLTVSGTPFTLTISGTTVNEVTGAFSDEHEHITITGTGYYQGLKSVIDKPTFFIEEDNKHCTMDIYKTTYWDAANRDFRLTGCRFEWTPDQNNWDIDFKIYHHKNDGSLFAVDNISFDDADEHPRASVEHPGKYKRIDYDTVICGSAAEGLILEIDQDSIGNFYFELRYNLVEECD